MLYKSLKTVPGEPETKNGTNVNKKLKKKIQL